MSDPKGNLRGNSDMGMGRNIGVTGTCILKGSLKVGSDMGTGRNTG